MAHRAVPGGYNVNEREGKRTAIYGEKPFYDPMGETLSEQQLRTGRGVKVQTNGVNGSHPNGQ